jgi:MoxR-like ATPase
VLLTSNNTRELSEALKRRCLYLFIDYPSQETEINIVRMRVPQLSARLAQQAVEVVQQLRLLDLKKSPSVSETIDWARALVMLSAEHLDRETLENTLTVLLKHESDVQKAKRALAGPGDTGRAQPATDPRRRRSRGDWNE